MNERTPLFRHYQPSDLEQLSSLLSAAAEADEIDPRSTLESLVSPKDLKGLEILVAQDKKTGEVMGYGTVRWWEEDDGTYVYLHRGTIHPAHRRQGIGSALIARLQAKARQISVGHPKDAPKVFAANASATEVGANELFASMGYKRVWSQVEMGLTSLGHLSRLKTPPGYELKDVKNVEEKRAVYDANKEVYAGMFGSSRVSEADFEEFLEDSPGTSLWNVLWHDDIIAGFVLSRVRGDRAEIMEVTVVPQFRRQGLGSYLMVEALLALRARGLYEVRLHTDAEGKMGGRQLYESLGFIPLKEHYRYRKSFK
jgi:mycothiol synthase